MALVGVFAIAFQASAACVTFTKEDWADPDLAANQDRITDNVWITRGDMQGLFNAANESNYGFNTPTDTQWYHGECGEDPSAHAYDTWNNVMGSGGLGPPNAVGENFCMHLITDDLYFDVVFTDWTQGSEWEPFSFHISQENDQGQWEEKYVQPYPVEYATYDFAFDKINDQVKVRVVQRDTDFGDVEQVSLDACGEEIEPQYAQYVETGQDVSFELAFDDLNVIVAHDKEVELVWDIPASCNESVTMTMKANEYGTASPFIEPRNSYYSFSASHNEPINLDGLISELEDQDYLEKPYWEPVTGHPDAYTYIYTSVDGENAYFSLDITMDNTDDYGKDYLIIHTKDENNQTKEFRIDDYTSEYGLCGFGTTSNVSYRHQMCEVKIPLDQIGTSEFDFKVEYYGTGGAPNGGGFSYTRCDMEEEEELEEGSCNIEGTYKLKGKKYRGQSVYLYSKKGKKLDKEKTKNKGKFEFEDVTCDKTYYLKASQKKKISQERYNERKEVYRLKYLPTFGEKWIEKFEKRYKSQGDKRYVKYRAYKKVEGGDDDVSLKLK